MNLLEASVKRHRKALHQIPEIGFDLPKTHTYIKEQLLTLGYEVEVVAQTGLVAIKKGLSEKMIAFRSDMDALEVRESTDLDYPSTHPGKMHACGHDGHMSILLGFAEHLTTLPMLKKSVMLLFQPAEENPGGARVIIEEGLFERYDVEAIFGIHLYPDLEEGIYGFREGAQMPQSAELYVDIYGVSAHGAQPHRGKDAIVAAANYLMQIQTIGSRNMNPLDSTVLTIGKIQGGEALNIIANHVKMSGTIRAYNPDAYLEIKNKLNHITEGVERSFGVNIENRIVDFYPPVVNDSNLFFKLRDGLPRESFRIIDPMMFAEDFSYYQKVVPGMFVMLGTKNETLGYTAPLHNNKFNFSEQVLLKGIALYDSILEILEVK